MVIYPFIDGWFFFRTGWEIAVGLARFALLAILPGIAFGAAVAVLPVLPALLVRRFSRSLGIWRYTEQALIVFWAVAVAVVFLRDIFQWLAVVFAVKLGVTAKYTIWLIFVLCAAGWLGLALYRRRLPPFLSRFFVSGVTRRNVLAFGGAAAAVTVADLAFPRDGVSAAALRKGGGASRPNILLVVFDSLNAEDMSVYGYHLPTTPQLDRFAETATTFRQCYSCATFTTPSVAAFSSGRYPSNTHVYHLYGALHGDDRAKTLPYVLQTEGYETAASVSNTAAHPAITCVGGYDFAPAPPVTDEYIRTLYEYRESAFLIDSWGMEGVGANAKKLLFNWTGPVSQQMIFPPQANFEQAERIWRRLRGPKFLYVHLMAPHFPYLPSSAFRGRFVDSKVRLCEQVDSYILPDNRGSDRPYRSEHQPFFDRLRLRYDEWIAETDAAFGAFMAGLEASGELANTIVAVTADHGESFQGGIWMHRSPSQLRSIIHIPLIVRRPGQTRQLDITTAADAASLAPTLLDLAGFTVPSWMDGASLRGVMENPETGGEGFAFTQHFENNSVFKPITKGTVGVIDGWHQYIGDLSHGKGSLYDLADAHLHSHDISAHRPDVVRALQARLRARFPALSIPA